MRRFFSGFEILVKFRGVDVWPGVVIRPPKWTCLKRDVPVPVGVFFTFHFLY